MREERGSKEGRKKKREIGRFEKIDAGRQGRREREGGKRKMEGGMEEIERMRERRLSWERREGKRRYTGVGG